MNRATPCPICGAYSRRNCELPEMSGVEDIECQWEELDPDILREDRDERQRLERERE